MRGGVGERLEILGGGDGFGWEEAFAAGVFLDFCEEVGPCIDEVGDDAAHDVLLLKLAAGFEAALTGDEGVVGEDDDGLEEANLFDARYQGVDVAHAAAEATVDDDGRDWEFDYSGWLGDHGGLLVFGIRQSAVGSRAWDAALKYRSRFAKSSFDD